MTASPTLLLNDGHALPALGFGTWPLDDAAAEQAVACAIQTGYRLIDTAARYGNETGVGRGLQQSGVPRGDLFLTSKLRGTDHGYGPALKALDATLARLDTDYLDLFLIHWPQPTRDNYVDAWRALIDLRAAGKVRSIGVSNFQPAHIDRLIDATGEAPAVNQIELNPAFSQPDLRDYHAGRRIVTQSWSPIGRGRNLADPALTFIADKHGKTPAQVVLRWHLQLGLAAIPKTQHPDRMAENFAVFDFVLDQQDIASIQELDRGVRTGFDPDTYVED